MVSEDLNLFLVGSISSFISSLQFEWYHLNTDNPNPYLNLKVLSAPAFWHA